ncbi:MAG: pyridoxamine 5'-phosphate oxidase family protein [Flavobacteriales bacterium]|nr:pyridoxamine 5'-phosphate oxidase family protein [Flavobacteriales bacterium]
MKLNSETLEYIDQSVLCWLATSSNDQPNVSPKEIFDVHNNTIIIANIASPQSVKNIKSNEKVCVCFLNILSQKGVQIKGTARILTSKDLDFKKALVHLEKKTLKKFPIISIIQVSPLSSKLILAPSYIFYPEKSEKQKIEEAKMQYRLNQ